MGSLYAPRSLPGSTEPRLRYKFLPFTVDEVPAWTAISSDLPIHESGILPLLLELIFFILTQLRLVSKYLSVFSKGLRSLPSLRRFQLIFKCSDDVHQCYSRSSVTPGRGLQYFGWHLIRLAFELWKYPQSDITFFRECGS